MIKTKKQQTKSCILKKKNKSTVATQIKIKESTTVCEKNAI